MKSWTKLHMLKNSWVIHIQRLSRFIMFINLKLPNLNQSGNVFTKLKQNLRFTFSAFDPKCGDSIITVMKLTFAIICFTFRMMQFAALIRSTEIPPRGKYSSLLCISSASLTSLCRPTINPEGYTYEDIAIYSTEMDLRGGRRLPPDNIRTIHARIPTSFCINQSMEEFCIINFVLCLYRYTAIVLFQPNKIYTPENTYYITSTKLL